jgi:dienelactone hydrolase
MRSRGVRSLLLALLALAVIAVPALAFSAPEEAKNYSKINERQAEYNTPAYQQELTKRSAERQTEAELIKANDPERDTSGNLCANPGNGCAGDVRLYDWQKRGFGIVKPLLYTARNGSTISGHVWMTRAGPAHRPGIVITNGSVQAPEQLYWFAAQTLAKRGYVVLTVDPQGQGLSDTYGEGADRNDGVPSQTGRPFYDGTEDALDFFYSSPTRHYEPRKSCTTGTSHRAKQDRRVKSHLDTAYNPLYSYFDHKRLGLAGHSLGAAAISFVGQKDPRVKAIVAWDNLATPADASEFQGQKLECASNPKSRTAPAITKPALGMSADYFLTPEPYTSDPDPQGKSAGSLGYTKAGVDTGELIIRGGTHYEFSYIPNPGFGASLRGMDSVAWYTAAWFDKYVKGGDKTADARLLTDRWRKDSTEAGVDPNHDGNLFSFYYRSRLNFHRTNGSHVVCDDVRKGCSALSANDGFKGRYSYLAAAQTKDHANPKPDRRVILLPTPSRCRTHRSLTFGLRARPGDPLREVAAYVNGKLARRIVSRHMRTRVNLRFIPRGRFRVTISVRTRGHRRYTASGKYHPCA